MQRFHLPPYRGRNDRHQERELQRVARLADSAPVRRDRAGSLIPSSFRRCSAPGRPESSNVLSVVPFELVLMMSVPPFGAHVDPRLPRDCKDDLGASSGVCRKARLLKASRSGAEPPPASRTPLPLAGIPAEIPTRGPLA